MPPKPAGFDSPVFYVEKDQELERLPPRVHLAGSDLPPDLLLPGLALFSRPSNKALAAAELLTWVQGPVGCSWRPLVACAHWKR